MSEINQLERRSIVRTEAVSAERVAPFVAQITMHDRRGKNTFTDELISGLLQAFSAVGGDLSIKAVVLTGYDTYFATGATRDGLASIQEGQSSFNNVNLYSLPLECPVPVISAMQGHGIGGGFVLGLYADIVVLAREAVYSTNFMRYGFTPGMGGTCIVPAKLGLALAQEMLLNGGSFRGAELEKRGVPHVVLRRHEVVSHALDLARELAEKPRLSLVTLKRHLTRGIRGELEDVISRELRMHDITVGQDEVARLIDSNFGS